MNRNATHFDRQSSPRVRMAARLWASGAVRTKREAARVMGVNEGYLSLITSPTVGSEQVNRIVGDTQAMIENETIDISRVLQVLGRKAIGKLAHLMESGSKEDIQLRAAQDLADRNSETQKVQRHIVDQFTLSGEDAREIAKAMVESARLSQDYKHVATDGLVEVEVEERHGG